MTTVFIAGSIAIKKLHPLFRERLFNVVQSGFDIVVGDADGADSSIQKELFELKAERVTVYYAGVRPRNNIGGWDAQKVSSDAKAGTRDFFTAKDLKMAGVADFGLMVWDTKSTGTLSNVLELIRLGRKSVVFINKEKDFINVCTAQDVNRLIGVMSELARFKAEDKIKLSKKVGALSNLEFNLN